MMVGPSKEWEWPEVIGTPSAESFLARDSFLTGDSTLVGVEVSFVGVTSFLDERTDEDRELFCCS